MEDLHVLVVEDEPSIRHMLRFGLRHAGLRVSEAVDVRSARLTVAATRPDMILLDWMLPDASGADFARELKTGETTSGVAIIMVTAKSEAEDRVRGLEVGCDDYVTKPFSMTELIARVRAVLRRKPAAPHQRVGFGGLVVDTVSQRVSAGALTVRLGPTEYRLLHFFISHPDRVFSREQLLERVWGCNVALQERTVDVHIRRLRRALSPHGYAGYVQTVHGSGYRFSNRDTSADRGRAFGGVRGMR